MEKKQNLRTNQVPAKVLLNSDARKSNQGNVKQNIKSIQKHRQLCAVLVRFYMKFVRFFLSQNNAI